VPFTDFPPATDLDLDLVRRDRLGLLGGVRRRGLDVTLLGGEVVLWRELVVGSGHLRLLRTRLASPSTVRVVPGRGPPGRAPAALRRRRARPVGPDTESARRRAPSGSEPGPGEAPVFPFYSVRAAGTPSLRVRGTSAVRSSRRPQAVSAAASYTP